MGISGAGDTPWLAQAVEEARRRAEHVAPDDWSEAACRVRQEALDVEEWERRRRGRAVRLWVVHLKVRAAALDVDDARFRLAGYLRHPYHRSGNVPALYSTTGPVACTERAVLGDRDRLVRDYPRPALLCRDDRTPYGAFERAHVADYAAALTAGSRRAAGTPAPRREPVAPLPGGVRLSFWRVRHRVLVLAGPGEAPERAEELASTIVDSEGWPAATVVGIEPDDGHRSPLDGHWVHPVAGVGPFAADALWDDYDAAEHDAGDPAALAAVLDRAARALRGAFDVDAHADSAPPRASEACPAALRHAAEQAHHRAVGTSASELRDLASAADELAGRVADDDREDDAERLRRQAAVYRRLSEP
ncbi:hypothetical protein ACFS2C_14485 [Prauserella oleivorans]|uniref:Uncharacterized protein n=1 Tax=Prauserella oleivorans TaxID=1478153 RepID=A0ABW5WBI8_9PSEU